MARTKKTKSKKKGFSLTPTLKKKSTNKKALMAKESFLATHKSEIVYKETLVEIAQLMAFEQSTQKRSVFSLINKSGGSVPSDKQINEMLGTSTTEGRNVSKLAEAAYSSQKELTEGQYIPDEKRNIKSLKTQIKNKQNKLAKEVRKQKENSTPKRTKRIDKLQGQIAYLGRKLNTATSRLGELEASLEIGQFSVCFGSKKLMREFNYSLRSSKDETLPEEERLEAHKEYSEKKSKWQFDRNSEYFAEGHSVQISGNSRIQLTQSGENFDLKINVPQQFQHRFGSTVTVENVSYGEGRRFQEVCQAVKTSKKKGRNSTEYPVTQRLKLVQTKHGVGVQIVTTVHTRKAEIVSDRRNGAMGVDFNQHSLDWAIVDYYGNPVASGKIPLSTQDRNTNQTKDAVSKAASQLFEIAIQWGVPIHFEDLSFKKNSQSFKSKGKKFARMASNLPFSTFKELVQQKSYRTGIAVKFVNPAFTSIQGLYKYMVKYGLSSGTAAGVVIARRGLGFEEKILQSTIKVNAGLFPEDNIPAVDSTAWSDWGKVSRSRKSGGKHARHQFFGLTDLMGVYCPDEEENSPRDGGRKDSSSQEESSSLLTVTI